MATRSLLLAAAAVLLGLSIVASRAEEAGLKPQIRALVGEINAALPKYSRETRSVAGLSLEGSEAVYFSEGGVLKKITARIYGETYNGAAELYYQGGAVAFAYRKLNRYDTQVGMQPPPKVVSTQEARLYFSGGALAALRIGQEDIADSDIQWREAEEEIAELASQLEAEFRKR
jgi:hypothetical protein